jgi:hypothetical protein
MEKASFTPMTKQDDCLDHAAQTLELAGHVSDSAERSHLLDLAEKWLALADRRFRQSKNSAGAVKEHPSVGRAFSGLKRSVR